MASAPFSLTVIRPALMRPMKSKRLKFRNEMGTNKSEKKRLIGTGAGVGAASMEKGTGTGTAAAKVPLRPGPAGSLVLVM